MFKPISKAAAFLALSLLLAACSKGGQLILEPGAAIVKSKGTPYVSVTQGGHANLSSAGGVTGWVTIQPISSTAVTGGGHVMILSKPSTY